MTMPYNPTREEQIQAWIREHKAQYVSSLTGRPLRALLAVSAMNEFDIKDAHDPLWSKILDWCEKETRGENAKDL